MAMDIRIVIFTIAYAIISNIFLVEYANMGIGIECQNVNAVSFNDTFNYTDESDSNLANVRANAFDLALGRCEGLPWWIYWIFEIPFIIGIAYIIRGFIGAT